MNAKLIVWLAMIFVLCLSAGGTIVMSVWPKPPVENDTHYKTPRYIIRKYYKGNVVDSWTSYEEPTTPLFRNVFKFTDTGGRPVTVGSQDAYYQKITPETN